MRALTVGVALLMLAALGSLAASPLVGVSLWPTVQILLAGSLTLAVSRLPLGSRAATAVTAALAGGATALLLLSLIGTAWPAYKLPWLSGVYGHLPTVRNLPFPGISDGFQPNQIGGLLALAFSFFAGVALLGSRRSWPGPLLWPVAAALALLSLPLLVLTGSRAGLAGALLALFVLLCLRVPRLAWLPALGAVLTPLLALLWSDLPTRVAAVFLRDETLDTKLVARLDIWHSALRGIEDHAVTGIGLGVFNEVVPIRYPYESVGLSYSVSQAHNIFLDTALTMGLPGLAGLLVLLAGVVILARRGLKRDAHVRPLAAGALAAAATYLVFGMTDGLSLSSPGSLTLWGVAILLAAFCGRASGGTSPPQP
jgi:exopolysaccharide production protein ExoQ